MKRRKSITNKVMASFMLITTIAFAITMVVLTLTFKKNIISVEERALMNEAGLVTEKINLIFAEKGMLVKQLANDHAIISYIDTLPSRGAIKTTLGYPEILKTLQNTKATQTDATSIYFVSEKGNALITHNEEGAGSDWDLLKRDWYIKTKEKGSTFYSEPYVDAVTKQTVITIAHPVTKNGKIIGATCIDLSVDSIMKYVSEYKIGKAGFLVLLDQTGTVLYHQNSELILKKLPDDLKDVTANMLKGEKAITRYKLDGDMKIGAYAPISSSHWSILAVQPESEILAVVNKTKVLTFLIYGGALIFLFLGILVTMKKILKDIPKILDAMNEVKEGNLNVALEVRTQDEIGQIEENFNLMVGNIKNLILSTQHVGSEISVFSTEISTLTDSLKASSQESAHAVDEIAIGATNQAKETEEVARVTLDLDLQFKNILSSIQTLNDTMKDAEAVNHLGLGAVDTLKEKNDFTNKASESIETTVKHLAIESNNVETILQTITSISQQTNLLALNASIEAARAGDAGRGFAVVADEIRKLAEGSAKSVDEIRQIIFSIKSGIEDAVEKTLQTRTVITEQSESVGDVNEAFNKISSNIKHMIVEIEDSTHIIEELNQFKDIIVNNVGNISAVSQETAATTEEVAATIQDQSQAAIKFHENIIKLDQLVLELNEKINRFKL